MGKKIVVGTQIMRVIKDDMLPNSAKNGAIKAIMKGGPLPEYLIQELLGSIGFKADKMYKFGASDKYLPGLPSGEMRSLTQGTQEVKAVLEGLEGVPVAIDYCRISKLNLMHLAWMKIISDWGYNPMTNQLDVLTTQKTTPVYLSDMIVYVPANQINTYTPGSLDQWGNPPNATPSFIRSFGNIPTGSIRKPTPVHTDAVSSIAYVKVIYVYERLVSEPENGQYMPKGSPKYGELTLNVLGSLDQTKEWLHVKYARGSLIKWVLYQMGSGVYPTIDAITLAPPSNSGTYYPFAYFRYEKKSDISDKTSAQYKSSKGLVKALGLDYDQIAEAIDQNPDIADVIQAMMVFGVPPETTVECEKKYLFDYFNNLYLDQDSTYRKTSLNVDKANSIKAGYGNITDGWNKVNFDIADKRFRMRFSARGIFKALRGGNIGPKGKYFSGKGTETYAYTYVEGEGGEEFTATMPMEYYLYQFQMTEGVYAEIKVYGLEMQYYIYGDHRTTSNETKDILLVPLDKSLLESYSLLDKEQLYSRSLHFVFNSMMVVKTKWYQSGWFQVVLIIAAVVVSIFLEGMDGGVLIAAAVAAGNTAVIITLVLEIIVALVSSFAIGFLVETIASQIGGTAAMILAVVAMAVAGYMALDAGSVAGAPWAKELLQVSSNLMQAGVTGLGTELMEKYDELSHWAEEATRLLDEGNRLLNQNVHLSPMTLFGETPSDFYNRTIHAGNIGILGLDAIHSYVDDALTLPKIDQTLGEFSYD